MVDAPRDSSPHPTPYDGEDGHGRGQDGPRAGFERRDRPRCRNLGRRRDRRRVRANRRPSWKGRKKRPKLDPLVPVMARTGPANATQSGPFGCRRAGLPFNHKPRRGRGLTLCFERVAPARRLGGALLLQTLARREDRRQPHPRTSARTAKFRRRSPPRPASCRDKVWKQAHLAGRPNSSSRCGSGQAGTLRKKPGGAENVLLWFEAVAARRKLARNGQRRFTARPPRPGETPQGGRSSWIGPAGRMDPAKPSPSRLPETPSTSGAGRRLRPASGFWLEWNGSQFRACGCRSRIVKAQSARRSEESSGAGN